MRDRSADDVLMKINFNIPRSLAKDLKFMSVDSGITMTEIVTNLIKKAVKNYQPNERKSTWTDATVLF